MLTIEPATIEDLRDLAENLLPSDAAELEAAGLTAAQALRTIAAQALKDDGQLVCLFGVEPHPQGGGIPWMLSTTRLPTVAPAAMVATIAQVVGAWKERFPSLTNLMHRHNHRAQRLVRWLGFRIDPAPCGRNNQFFVFRWERSDV